ncbi:unnamed protein product [Leuciscus chuanchicus]
MPRRGKRSESQKQRRNLKASCGTNSSTSGAAVHNERNELLGFDLDRILQKGDALYTSVKKTLRSKGQFVANFFNFDELPSTVKTNSACYNILKHPQRVGFLKDSPVLGEYENLENTLQCLRADVSDALLMCGCSCIAVFRDRSGRFGYFDSHCRSAYGMPEDESTGTAVMLTFFRLEDMIERLLLLFQGCFDLRDQQQFDLLPVSFINRITERSVRPEVSPNCCELERDVQPSVSFENEALSNKEQCRSADVSQLDVQVQDVQPSTSFENEALSNKEQCRSADVSQLDVQVQDPFQQLSETTVNSDASTEEQAHLTNQYKIKQRDTLQNNQPDAVQDPTVLRALHVFREVIKQGPTYVCTCCARALFSNQVKSCDRERYQKNPTAASVCLTGNYVHVCSDCPDQCPLENRKTEWICHCCHNTLMRGLIPDIALANKLQFAPIPPELCDLNVLERHVIAKYIPFAKIVTLPKGQQRAIKGAVISVASEVETTVNSLPRPRSESQLLTVKLKRRLCYKGHYQFQTLNMQKVLSALRKLKDIHSEYKDILINAEFSEEEMFNEHEQSANDISAPDEEMDIENTRQSENTEEQSNENEHNDYNDDTAEEQSRGLALDTCLQPPDLGQQLLSYNDGIFCIAPAERNSPVNTFKIPKLESMAFPVQFPDGKNTFDEPGRAKHVSPSRYFNSRLFSIDNRCAKDTNYIFFAQFVTEMNMATSSMSIQLRKGKPMTRDGRRINCSMLQDKQELEKLVINKEATRFMQPLRGTPAYWEKSLRDLFAMLRQLGTPTFFCTFSAAEMRWPDVITAIKAQQGETVNFAELDWSEKCEILRSNSVTAMRMFEKRVEALMRDLINSPARPIGEVIDFFYRVEFQLRGSPHIHCLFWVKDAPEFEKDQDQDVCDFIDKYISCKLPDPDKDPELHKIVSEVQMHSRNHSKSCKKNKKHCRFGFPKPPINRTMISRPRPPPVDQSDEGNESEETNYASFAKEQLQNVWDLLNDSTQSFDSITQLLHKANMTYEEYEKHIDTISTSSSIFMERRPQDCWVNGYNPMLLRAWDANMDIQFILNPYSCIMYIVSYISKAEHEMSDYLKKVIKDSSHDDLSERESMKQIMNAYAKNREVSAQEAVARTCSLKLKSSSRAVIFIPTDDNAVKMSLPMRCLQTMDDDIENVWMTGLPEKYKARPNRPEFENMCMAEFASEYRIVYAGQQKE